MNRTQLVAELQAYGRGISAQWCIARDALPDTPEMEAWRRELNLIPERLCGRWLYEQVDRLDADELQAFFAAFGGEDQADRMARENPAGFLSQVLKFAMG